MAALKITRRLVDNHSSRRGYIPLAIVDHVMEGTMEGTLQHFSRPSSAPNPVSAHYGVGRGGEVVQYVEEGLSAFHAGRVLRPTAILVRDVMVGVNPNLYTIGIEHEGSATSALTPAQLEASALLHADIARRYAIPLDRRNVIGHREIFAEKTCPGGIDVDAIVARANQLLLPAARLSKSAGLPTLRRGSRGDAVGVLQRALGVAGPHTFGPRTEAAVRSFQEQRGLTVDGVVGPQTWRAVLGS